MFDDDDRPPRFPHDGKERSFCRVSYWKDNTHCGNPVEWNRCTVTPTGPYTWGEQVFTREEANKIQSLLAFLDKAFNAGRADAKEEIRRVLGV